MYILYFSLLYIYLIFGCIVIIGILCEEIKSMERKSKVYYKYVKKIVLNLLRLMLGLK